MEIRYSLTRAEIFLSFLQAMAKSPKLLAKVLVFCLLPGAVGVTVSGVLTRRLTFGDAVSIILWMIGAFCFMVLWLFIRGKTAERTLSVSEAGISTTIGKLRGEIAWGKIADVKEAGRHILVIGSSGNAFFIPDRAFSSPDQKMKFISDVREWRGSRLIL
ncbi:MAG TPA: YcxB family protein [Terracidiphilus sp.]|jgi:hypothetical protein|nr:YcxB family protein [Terracidiphilus sp.]